MAVSIRQIRDMDSPIETVKLTPKLIEANLELDNLDVDKYITQDEIKRELVNLLIEKLLHENFVIFTKHIDPYTMNYRYNARIFAATNGEVRQLLVKQSVLDNGN